MKVINPRKNRTRPLCKGVEEYVTLSSISISLQNQLKIIKKRMKFLKEQGEAEQ